MSARTSGFAGRFMPGKRFGAGRDNNAQTPDTPDQSSGKDDNDDDGKPPNEQNGQGGEGQQEGQKDEESNESKPVPVGFWHSSLAHVRKEAMLKWVLTTTILMAFILAVLSIYWGSLWQIPQHLHNLNILVVDFDGRIAPYDTSNIQPIVGPTVISLTEGISDKVNLNYQILPPSDFNNDPTQVRQAIYNWHAWGAIIVNANATEMLYSAVQHANTSYEPTGACQLIYVSARDDTTWYDFILPLIMPIMTEITASVGERWTKLILQEAANNATLAQNLIQVPQALSPSIGFSMYDLRPFYPYQAIPATSIGLIYLIIVSFFSFSFYLPIHMKYLKPEGHPPLKFWQLIVWRWFATISAYFMLSLAYSLVSLAFQINFAGGNPVTSETAVTVASDGNPDAYGHATFIVYWMLNFIGMIALGLACENVAMFVGQPWMSFWLIFWVITNVATSFYNIAIEPGFFHWGYAWPLHNIVEGSRQVLFGLHPRLGLNFAVLFAWGAVNSAIFPFACYFMRWKSNHHVHEYYK